MPDFLSLWSGFGAETKAAIIQAFATVFVGIIGFGGLFLQMRCNGIQSRNAVAENERRRMKAAMYEDAVTVCREVGDNAIELSTVIRRMMLQINIVAQANADKGNFELPTARFPALLQQYAQFSESALKFIFLVENGRFIDPNILVFRTAIGVVLYDTRKIMHSEFVDSVMLLIPAQRPDGSTFPYTPPTIAEAAVVTQQCDRFLAALTDATMYTEDFLVEMQNALLSDLFGKAVEHRKPIDPAEKVITLKSASELENWFAKSTDWGREMARIEAETSCRFSEDQKSLVAS